MYYSDTEDRLIHGVGIPIYNKMSNYEIGLRNGHWSLKLNAKLCAIHIFALYAPTLDADDEAIDEFYKTVQATMDTIPNKDILPLKGDFKAKIGSTSHGDHIR